MQRMEDGGKQEGPESRAVACGTGYRPEPMVESYIIKGIPWMGNVGAAQAGRSRDSSTKEVPAPKKQQQEGLSPCRCLLRKGTRVSLQGSRNSRRSPRVCI